jgi:CubicO group peptidase (beta-lactamase class C family)
MNTRFPVRSLCIIIFVLLSLSQASAQSPDIAGRWQGAIELPGQKLDLTIELKRSDGTWSGTIDIPAQGAKGLPLEKITIAMPKVAFAIGGVPGDPTFNGEASGDVIAGKFTQGGSSFPFSLKRQSGAESGKSEAALTSTLDSIRTFASAALEEWNVPGMALAIVKDGKVVLSEGFGYRDAAAKLPVTPNTLFAIGSSTKAFTAYIIGSLVAEGKLDWDTPVIHYLPDFKLKDRYATEQMTPRDLLNHISGLPRHDIVWYGSNLSRRELFERLQYLEPNAEFRSKWQYQNLMFVTAGYLAERVSGKSWETLVRERIFGPLGMSASNFSVDSLKMAPEHALGYNEDEGKVERIDYRNIDAIGPAGSINSNIVDMSRWVMLHLADGREEGKELIPENIMRQLHAPQVVMPGGLSSAKDGLLFNLYANGWMEHAFRGHRLLEHGGNIDGFSAMVTFMPDDDIGMVILTNMNETNLPEAVMFTAYDRLLGYSESEWNGKMLAQKRSADSMMMVMDKGAQEEVVRVPNTRPSHPLKEYAGEFENPAYGVITIREVRDRLQASYHGFTAPLEHFHYDVFEVANDSLPIDATKIQFRSNLDGDIETLLIALEPAVAPIEFTRRASESLADTALLRRYVGEYDLAGQTIRVHLEGSTLVTSLAGQPDYELVPRREGEFDLKGLKGYSVRFEMKKGGSAKLVLIQPNGVFTAVRKE